MSRRRRSSFWVDLLAAGLIGLIVGVAGYRWAEMTADGAVAIGGLVFAFVLRGSVRLPYLRSPIGWRTSRTRRRRHR